MSTTRAVPALTDLAAEFATVTWTREALGAAMKAAAARHGIKPGQVMMALRVLVCGTRETPAIDACCSAGATRSAPAGAEPDEVGARGSRKRVARALRGGVRLRTHDDVDVPVEPMSERP